MKRELKTYIENRSCECGGEMIHERTEYRRLSSDIQYYKCDSCGDEHKLNFRTERITLEDPFGNVVMEYLWPS